MDWLIVAGIVVGAVLLMLVTTRIEKFLDTHEIIK
jgi:hypothetical protein